VVLQIENSDFVSAEEGMSEVAQYAEKSGDPALVREGRKLATDVNSDSVNAPLTADLTKISNTCMALGMGPTATTGTTATT
jgi:hypothetical protein